MIDTSNITVSEPLITEPTAIDRADVKTPDKRPGACPDNDDPVTKFLVQVGKVVLKNEKQDWLDLDTVCKLCREHNIQLKGKFMGRDELEELLTAYFTDTDEMFADGVNAVAWIRKVKWEWVFQLRFYKCRLHNTPPFSNESILAVCKESPKNNNSNN